MPRRQTLFRSHHRRGTTMTEMVITAGIFSIIAVFVTVVTIAIGTQSRHDLMTAPAEAEAYRALDYIRNQLLRAQYGTVRVWDENSRISYLNPNTGKYCAITFDTEKEQIVFSSDFDMKTLTGKDETVWGRRVTGRFDLTSTPKRVLVSVHSTSKAVMDSSMTTSYTDTMTIRN